ncbi:MAG: FAD-dependent oxidoreductase [Thermodesulfobacteriota bacterium]
MSSCEAGGSPALAGVQVSGLTLGLSESAQRLPSLAARRAGVPETAVRGWRVLRRSLDARGRREPRYVFRVGLLLAPGTPLPPPDLPFRGSSESRVAAWAPEDTAPRPLPQNARAPAAGPPPLVVGTGPAGLFAALRLAAYGWKPLLLERGDCLDERIRTVARYWRRGELDPESNVQFGEGGAGTFSDGKLTYRGKDPRRQWVLEQLVAAGAPEEILFDARAHLGTDRLRGLLRRLRAALEAAGAEVRFRSRVQGLLLREGRVAGVETSGGQVPGRPVFLAPGHSARDLVSALAAQGVAVEPKGFAVGLRVEVPQERVDRNQYGSWAGHPGLPPGEFAVKARTPGGRDVYSFCMCPGGVVIPAGSEAGGLVVNGMSASGRTGRWANAALVAAVGHRELGPGPLAGHAFQREWESRAGGLGGERGVPAQRLEDFVAGRPSRDLPPSSCPWPTVPADLASCLPPWVAEALRSALPDLIRQVGALKAGLLLGVETRTSSPVRLTRATDGQAPGFPGLYPVGEGAGYAGGIVSAAVDGVRAVDAYAEAAQAAQAGEVAG